MDRAYAFFDQLDISGDGEGRFKVKGYGSKVLS